MKGQDWKSRLRFIFQEVLGRAEELRRDTAEDVDDGRVLTGRGKGHQHVQPHWDELAGAAHKDRNIQDPVKLTETPNIQSKWQKHPTSNQNDRNTQHPIKMTETPNIQSKWQKRPTSSQNDRNTQHPVKMTETPNIQSKWQKYPAHMASSTVVVVVTGF